MYLLKHIKIQTGAGILLAAIVLAGFVFSPNIARADVFLCENGNYSNTEDGCTNQGSAVVGDQEVFDACNDTSFTQEERQQCIEGGGESPSETSKLLAEGDCKPPAGEELSSGNCAIIGYVQTAINVLSAIAGMVIAIMIAYQGIMYTMSRDNPQKTAEAKGKLVQAVIALVVFLFTYALLQWLVPGGVF